MPTKKASAKPTKSPKSSNPSVPVKGIPQNAIKGKPATPDDLAVMRSQREESDRKVKAKIKKDKEGSSPDNLEVRNFLDLALDRFRLSSEAEAQFRKESLDDLEFITGKQWDSQIKARRELDGRPCLTINRLPQFSRLVTNEMRQQRPAIQVNPVGDGATKRTAKIIQGIVRHIEVNSDSEVPYDTGAESQVQIGFGYWRLIREFAHDMSFDQEIKIKRIKNPFTVYFDPNACEHDYSDAEYCFIIADIPRTQYRHDYPRSQMASLSNFTSMGDRAPDWASQETIRVAEYFYAEYEDTPIVFLEDGTIIKEKDLSDEQKQQKVLARRVVPVRRIMWCQITALDILEGNDNKTAGKDIQNCWIPVVPVLGDDLDVNGKRYISGLIRHAKEPSRMYNYWVSAGTEMIALAPKAPFIGAVGQFKSREELWRQANVRNLAFLEYDPKTLDGQLIPPPQRNNVEPPIQAIGGMIRQADNDIKATIGIYDASLGQKGPDESGKAILARQKQGDVSTLNFSDNLARSIRHTGRIIIAWIPTTYTTPSIQRIINPDQTVGHVGIYNSKAVPGMNEEGAKQELGIGANDNPVVTEADVKEVFDVGVGLYDVTVSVGPSYQTKRQEAVNAMMSLVSSYPMLMQAAGDLLIQNMDWPGAQSIADRLKKMLPPQLQDNDSDDPVVRLSAMKSQMSVMMGQHQQLVQELTAATQTIQTKKLEIESKERIAAMTAQVQILVAEAKVQGEAALQKMDGELGIIMHRLDLLNANQSVDSEGDSASAPAIPAAPPPIAPFPTGAAAPPTGGQ